MIYFRNHFTTEPTLVQSSRLLFQQLSPPYPFNTSGPYITIPNFPSLLFINPPFFLPFAHSQVEYQTMRSNPSSRHFKAVLQALLVTFLWSTSWILIKIGLQAELPAITFAGLRYGLAFLCLAPFVLLQPAHRVALRTLPASAWLRLALLGLVFYTFTQGAQFLSLALLPAATVNLLLNLTPLVVALFGLFILNETPSSLQWGGILLCGMGAIVYFLPLALPQAQLLGLIVAGAGVLANAGSALLGREVNRNSDLPSLLITFVSMGIGAGLLLVVGVSSQGFGALEARQWVLIVWLALVNTAFAFTLWNHTLRTLTAVESSILNGMMLPQITLLAWFFLDEALTPKEIVGLGLVGIGTLIVQLRRAERLPDKVLKDSEAA
jgi:drug/metabolite transporter (DMT)-like permease